MSKKKEPNTKGEEIKPSQETESTDAPDTEAVAGDCDNNETTEEQKRIEEMSLELTNQKEAYLRLAAEYDNYRKRTQSEKLSIFSDATAKAVLEILPVADSLLLATSSMQDVPQEFAKGLELVNSQLKKSFDSLGVTSFGEVGDEFNPEIHNAVSKIDSEDLEKNTLAAVYQKGFKIGDKVVRHAMVQVANCD